MEEQGVTGVILHHTTEYSPFVFPPSFFPLLFSLRSFHSEIFKKSCVKIDIDVMYEVNCVKYAK